MQAYAKVRSGGRLDFIDHRNTNSEGLWDTPELGSVIAMAADDVSKGQPPRSRSAVLADLRTMMAK
jgi:hypothetical protein